MLSSRLMKQIGDVLTKTRAVARPKNLSTEFQQYGVFLADSLGDLNHYALYIKLAKTVNRQVLEEALSYAKGYVSAKSRARVFMWRLARLRLSKKRIAKG